MKCAVHRGFGGATTRRLGSWYGALVVPLQARARSRHLSGNPDGWRPQYIEAGRVRRLGVRSGRRCAAAAFPSVGTALYSITDEIAAKRGLRCVEVGCVDVHLYRSTMPALRN